MTLNITNIERLSTTVTGGETNGTTAAGILSPDGIKLLFSSVASNLVPNDTNNTSDVFVKDLTTGAMRITPQG